MTKPTRFHFKLTIYF